MSQFLRGYLLVPIFIAAAVGLVAVLLGLGSLLRPRRPSPQKAIPYESGVDPVGDGWSQSQVRYYWFVLMEMFVFILILDLGLLYAWRKGVLRWA